jgi:hypothetical protein
MVKVGPGGGLGDLRFEMELVRRARMERESHAEVRRAGGESMSGGEVWRGEAVERLNLRGAARCVEGFING